MNRDTLVSINISHDGKLDNPKLVPILFYWDGNGELIENIINDENFRKILIDKIANIDSYSTARLDWFYFTYNDGIENYNENTIDVQQLLPFKDIENVILWEEYAGRIFSKLYELVKKEKPKHIDIFDEYYITALYHSIKDKNPVKIRKNTVLEYVRSQLKEQYGLSQENADYIYDKLNLIIVDNG